MKIGISSSCFYPMLVEDSFRHAAELGINTGEVFFNSQCELHGSILKTLSRIKNDYGVDVRSIHPFTSAYETVMIFSGYERRTLDSIEFYKQYFEAANALGAKYVVLHGGKSVVPTTPEKYAQSYLRLESVAQSFGIHIAHENVREHYCADPKFMKSVADIVGDNFRMVLDIKQCRRSGYSEYDFIKLLGGKIAQVHLSDFRKNADCLPPGEGEYDFAKLFHALETAGYNESALIELYSSNFSSENELATAKSYLEKI